MDEHKPVNKVMTDRMMDRTVDGNVKVNFNIFVRKSCADLFFWEMDTMGLDSASMAFYRLVEYYAAHHPGYKPYQKQEKDAFGYTHTVCTYFLLSRTGKIGTKEDPAVIEAAKAEPPKPDPPKEAVPGP